MNNSILTPAIFFGHGSPMNAIEENQFTKKWQSVGDEIRKLKVEQRPKAILSISAHWQTRGTKVTGNKTPKTIHDFGGFPDELFAVEYAAKGDEELAARIAKLTGAEIDNGWGLDHGTWSVLAHVFTDADIPVLQLSLDRNKTLREHYEFAKKLSALRSENILIMGSGNIVHNLSLISWHPSAPPYDFSENFNEAIKAAIENNAFEAILNYQNFPGAAKSVPTDEHFLPLIYILALKGEGEKVEIFNDEISMGSISMMSVVVK